MIGICDFCGKEKELADGCSFHDPYCTDCIQMDIDFDQNLLKGKYYCTDPTAFCPLQITWSHSKRAESDKADSGKLNAYREKNKQAEKKQTENT